MAWHGGEWPWACPEILILSFSFPLFPAKFNSSGQQPDPWPQDLTQAWGWGRCGLEGKWLEFKDLSSTPVLWFVSCVTLGKSLPLSDPPASFSAKQNKVATAEEGCEEGVG